MKIPPPPKSYATIFFRAAQDLVLVQLTLIMQKINEKNTHGPFLGTPPKMHCNFHVETLFNIVFMIFGIFVFAVMYFCKVP